MRYLDTDHITRGQTSCSGYRSLPDPLQLHLSAPLFINDYFGGLFLWPLSDGMAPGRQEGRRKRGGGYAGKGLHVGAEPRPLLSTEPYAASGELFSLIPANHLSCLANCTPVLSLVNAFFSFFFFSATCFRYNAQIWIIALKHIFPFW